MQRPSLTPRLAAADFARWYWLKAELAAYCRDRGLPVTGSKQVLQSRVDADLRGLDAVLLDEPRRPAGEMPEQFSADTRIGPGWRCTRALRGYFESVHGPGFRFNDALRTFLREGAGRTLAEASARYVDSLTQPRAAIGAQFEYNRHIREFFQANPGATRDQAIAAWWARRRGAGTSSARTHPRTVASPTFLPRTGRS